MTSYETRTLSLIVAPLGEPTFSERATHIRIEDESGGEYIVIEQHLDSGSQQVAINPDEWPAIRAAIDALVADCRPVAEEMK